MLTLQRSTKRNRDYSLPPMRGRLGHLLMIKCTECYQEVVIKKDNRVYAIEEGRVGSPVCKLVMSKPVGHIPDQFLYTESTNNAQAN